MAIIESIGGGLIGGAGNLAGGLIAANNSARPRDMVLPVYDPALDLANQAAQFNALSGLGFGQIGSLPDPLQRLIGRIQNASIDEKTKRRALKALSDLRSQVDSGLGYEESLGNARNKGRLRQALGRLGVPMDSLPGIFKGRNQFRDQIQTLRDAGLDRINTDTVLNRYNAANLASNLIGEAAGIAGGGGVTSQLGQDLLSRDQRQLDQLRNQLGSMAALGGYNPAQAFAILTDRGLDQNLRVIQQLLGSSGAIQAALGGGTAAAQGGASQNLNSATIAAQQAAAANQLRASLQTDRALSLGNAISSSLGALGSGIANSGLLTQFAGQSGGESQTYDSTVGSGGGGFTNGGQYYGGLTPSIDSATSGTSTGFLGGLLALF